MKTSIQQYVGYFCRLLAGILFATASLADLYYIHTDHLATPKILTDQNQNVVWSADAAPFGEAATSGTVAFNLRFPGQYYDQETGMYYNYYRYYDPNIGRYMTSDPIGLQGGLNTYTYVDNNPLNFIDPEGNEKRTYGQRIIDVPEGRPLIEGQSPLAREPVVNGLIGLATLAVPELSIGRFCPPSGRVVVQEANPVPKELARAIAGRGNFPTLGPPSRNDVFVTAADDIIGLNPKQLAQKLTINEADTFTVIRFPTPESGLATPINRLDPGFVGGGRTAGRAREFVIPNGPIPPGATTKVIGR